MRLKSLELQKLNSAETLLLGLQGLILGAAEDIQLLLTSAEAEVVSVPSAIGFLHYQLINLQGHDPNSNHKIPPVHSQWQHYNMSRRLIRKNSWVG